MLIIRIVRNLDFQELGSLNKAVHADGEILAAQINVARIEQGQHAFALQFFQVLVVAHLHLVAKVDDFLKEGEVVHVVACGILDATVQVDGQHTLGTRGNASGTESVTEAVVLNLIAQTAARGKRVGIVAQISKERMAFGIHFGSEVSPLLVDDIAIV